jgi:hypothetical protein
MAMGGGEHRWTAVLALACAGACGERSLVASRVDAASPRTDARSACGDAFTMPPPSPTRPDTPGCFEGTDAGWVQVPCLCDLPIENDRTQEIDVVLRTIVSPPSLAQTLTLTGTQDIEIAFEDPGATWYAVLASEAGNGTYYAASNDGVTTTVRVGNGDYLYGNLPLAPCDARHVTARISGSTDATLTMWAYLDDPQGGGIGMLINDCANPPLPLGAVTPSSPAQ